MVMMPPSTRLFKALKDKARKCYAKTLANKKLSPMQKSKVLIDCIESIQYVNNIHGPYMANTYNALDKGYKPEDCIKRDCGRGQYLALDTVMRRLEEAFVLDKEIIRRAWVAVQEEALKQIASFGEEDAPQRARVWDLH